MKYTRVEATGGCLCNVSDYVKGLQDQREQLNQEIRGKTAGAVLQNLKETSEVVRLVPLQEQHLMDNLKWVLTTPPQGWSSHVVEETRTSSSIQWNDVRGQLLDLQ